ncbi:ATP-binding protein [Sphingobacterium paludis]|uniref:ATP-binding protein n=1 Tax=Sphingobacterium paludis TaxID=1476465 RepID=UPI002938FD7F|nr:ATP-binding protein [Sphingobacterium paludis]
MRIHKSGGGAIFWRIKTRYTITARIIKMLKLSKVDGTYLKELEKLVKSELLILDDFGL